MADVTITYKGETISELSASGTKTLKTGGKYCEDDITLQYVKPSGVGSYVGGTVAWNQFVQNGNFQSADKWDRSGNASLSVSDNVMTVHRDSGTGIVGGVCVTSSARRYSVSGHKYLICFTIQTINGNVNSFPTGTSSEGNTGYIAYPNKTEKAWIWNCQVSKPMMLELRGYTGSGVTSTIDFTVENYMCFDLTAMFGSTIADYIYALEQSNAGAGVEWINANGFFKKEYYEYQSEILKSVETFAHPFKDGNNRIIGYFPMNFDLELRGILSLDANNNLQYDGDEYDGNGTVTRKCGIRAYTSGDVTDGSTMITDGTNTVYKLITPTTESV